MRTEDEDEFRQFVVAQLPVLRRLAYLVCGNWHTAEDAVANALIKLYPRWRRLERPDLYAKTMVVRAAVDEKRRPWRREQSVGDAMPDIAGVDPAVASDDRLRMWAALRTVPVGQRTAVVLRYYHGLSVNDTAQVLGCSPGTAKSQATRGLARLREVLAADEIDLSEDSNIGEWSSAGT